MIAAYEVVCRLAVLATFCAAATECRAEELPDLAASVVRVAYGDELKGPCSGVVVAPDRVLTVGHCAAIPTDWRADARPSVIVVLGDRPYKVSAIRLSDRSPFDAQGHIQDLGFDWAVLEVDMRGLAQPVPFAGADALRAAYLTGDTLVKAGFAGRQGLQVTSGCSVLAAAADLRGFSFRCGEGMGPGLSGSPLLVTTATGLAIVGLQSAKAQRLQYDIGIAIIPPSTALQPP